MALNLAKSSTLYGLYLSVTLCNVLLSLSAAACKELNSESNALVYVFHGLVFPLKCVS